VRETKILEEQQLPKGVFTCDHSGLEINKSSEIPLISAGFGLPVSRLYAQYFGGDVHLVSMEG
jgi:hypothetical protein